LGKWYWRDAEGNVRFSVRIGNKRLELVDGRFDIIVGEDCQLPVVIEKFISAVEAGELDKRIAAINGS